MDPLDRSIQVEERLRPPHAVNSSDTQTESLGKLGREPIDSNLDWRGSGGARVAGGPLFPPPTPMRTLCTRERRRRGGKQWKGRNFHRDQGATLPSSPRPPRLTARPIT